MTTTVRAADAAQFLSFVPHLLGYRPTRSLVLIPFEGSRSAGALRFDLPATDDAHELDRIAATLVGTVCRIPRVDGVAAVAFTDESADDGMPHAALARAIEARAHECGLDVTDLLCVGSDAWASYLDADRPPGGRSLAELDIAPAGLPDLPVADGDQASGAELPRPDSAAREDVGRALRSLERAVALLCGPDAEPRRRGGSASSPRGRVAAPTDSGEPTACHTEEDDDATRIDPGALVAVCRLDDLPGLFEEALEWDAAALSPYECAALIWCLSRPSLRDIALVEWCGGIEAGDEALDAQLEWEGGAEYPAHLAMHMWGEGDRPDPDRLERALALARAAACVAPEDRRAGCLATAAWLSWALGRSTHAERYAVQACESEPEHGLAEIVRSFVHAGHLPDWAFRRPA
ncbi:DUF4192 family protein [Microbacterium ulmi]|uniref:DUF4192 family protein n=1 Tax=Microbacterium ulmi TaxID=179095 RepID=A0A7Y2LYR1_9MICO|nr:DUF4192 family protein [Microbacterium ulmi]NII69797.1 hypothetical protein [Microbacterium ulmi]NNH03232.1 DUF4192 family protein [Microbacterium ulmi]